MILQAQHLAKRFGPFQALHDVNLTLEAGEVVGFLGPNGAGKSTTMKILAGYLAPSGGEATINGFNVRTQQRDCRRQVGYLPQDLPLYRDMTVGSYLDHVARLKGIPKTERRNEVFRAIERANLQEVEKRHIHKLSGGNRQRAGLAQALIGTPPILILDEPTAGLDPAQVANFRDLIVALSAEHTILLSTHIMAEVEACCQRVVMVHRGRDIVNESIGELQQRARQVQRLRLRVFAEDHSALLTTLKQADWVHDIGISDDAIVFDAEEGRRSEIIALAEQHGGLRELVEQRRSLEEVFRDLIADKPAA